MADGASFRRLASGVLRLLSCSSVLRSLAEAFFCGSFQAQWRPTRVCARSRVTIASTSRARRTRSTRRPTSLTEGVPAQADERRLAHLLRAKGKRYEMVYLDVRVPRPSRVSLPIRSARASLRPAVEPGTALTPYKSRPRRTSAPHQHLNTSGFAWRSAALYERPARRAAATTSRIF